MRVWVDEGEVRFQRVKILGQNETSVLTLGVIDGEGNPTVLVRRDKPDRYFMAVEQISDKASSYMRRAM